MAETHIKTIGTGQQKVELKKHVEQHFATN